MNTRLPKIGVAGLARTTFDIPLAEEMFSKTWKNLEALNATVVGNKELLCDAEAVETAIKDLKAQSPDMLLIVQVTFTDAVMTVELAKQLNIPVLIWSFPEEREGDRLRLNSFCGLNLAAHALGKAEINFEFTHQAPDSKVATNQVIKLARAAAAVNKISESRLLVIGEHPDGFDTCEYDAEDLKKWCGVEVDRKELMEFLNEVPSIPDSDMMAVHEKLDKEVVNLGDMEEEPLKLSLKVFLNLQKTAQENNYNGLAVRCWPEFFTELGCAACGAMSMMNESKIPCACEADLYGVLTSLMMQILSDSPVFLSDLVDIKFEDNTGVFWHCGLAPLSMADPDKEVRAQIHTNRKKPFLYEFTLKPGRITFARISQSENKKKLIIGTGEVISAPMAFTGTSGVVRFDSPADEVLKGVITKKLEHHFSLAYGDYREELQTIAKMLNIPVETI